MKIGIFECGIMPETLQEEFISYPEMLIRSFKSINCRFDYTIYDVTQDQFPQGIHDCDVYITTGSRYSVNDGFDWIAKLEQFIQQCHSHQKKLVGICFGHQLLAKALGGKVEKNKLGTGIGVIENHLLEQKTWLQPIQQKFKIIISHEDIVVRLPDATTRLASNDHCQNFMFQIGEHFFGIQGHPEFNNAFSRGLMTARAELIPDNVLQVAYQSLSQSPDNPLLMQWIVNFLTTDNPI